MWGEGEFLSNKGTNHVAFARVHGPKLKKKDASLALGRDSVVRGKVPSVGEKLYSTDTTERGDPQQKKEPLKIRNIPRAGFLKKVGGEEGDFFFYRKPFRG